MAIPEAVRESQRRYLEEQGLADLGDYSVVSQGNSLYGCLPNDVTRSFGLSKGDKTWVYADFQNRVLLQTPAELVAEVNGDD